MTNPTDLQPISWYRPSPFGKIFKRSFICGSIMMIGVVTVGLGLDLSGRVNATWQPIFFLFGITTIITSILSAFWGYYRILMTDTTTLILERSGVRMQQELTSTFIAWTDIESIENQGTLISLKTKTDCFEIEETFLGINHHQLTDEIRELQRKILLGVI